MENAAKKRNLYRLGLILLVLFAFGQACRFESFVLDDPVHLQRNQRMGQLTFENVKHFWTHPYENAYMPVTYTSWLIVSAFAKQPPGSKDRFYPQAFRTTNVILHVLCVLLVFQLLVRLMGNSEGALFGALFFALHPVQVEPVGWVTGMRGLLVGIFCVSSTLCYLNYKRTAKKSVYFLALFLFLMGTLSKPAAYALLFIIPLIVRFYLKQELKTSFKDLLPWAIISALFLPLHMQLNGAVVERAVPDYAVWYRPFVAMDSIAFYFYKLVWPVELALDYGRVARDLVKTEWVFISSWLPLLLFPTLYCLRKKTWAGQLLVSLLILVLGLLPVLGLTPFIFQHISTVSDRYMYLGMIGPAMFIAWLFSQAILPKWLKPTLALVLALFFVKSHAQIKVWRNPLTLFSHNVKVTPHSWLANNNLGHALETRGELQAAYHYYREASKYAQFPAIWNNIGATAVSLGKYDEAIDAFKRIISVLPTAAEAYNNIGVAFLKKGNPSLAEKYFSRAVAIDPTMKNSKSNLIKLKGIDES